MYRYKQDPPFCIQIELVEGCNLRCPFCAINAIRSEKQEYKYMTLETAVGVARKIRDSGWRPRLEFAMHGEPSMHPHFIELIKVFRKRLPKNLFIMESNGVGFIKDTEEKLIRIFDAGITNLAIEDYEGVDYCAQIREVARGIKKRLKRRGVKRYEYPENKEGNPHQRGKYRKLSFLADISKASSGTHSNIHNSAGLAGERNDSMEGKRCAKPFREISVRWDGNVAICCNDWIGSYKIGNVLEFKSLNELWQSDEFIAARLKLYQGERDFGPCDGCDARSYRIGLLPDKHGKTHLPRADHEARHIIRHALKGEPYTKLVPRPWQLVQIEKGK